MDWIRSVFQCCQRLQCPTGSVIFSRSTARLTLPYRTQTKYAKNMQVIGIDHGYGNLKTASGIFPASVLTFDHEPVHAQDLLVYNGK